MTASRPDQSDPGPPLPVGKRLLMVSTVPEMVRNFLLPYADHYRQLGWEVCVAVGEPDRFPELRSHFDCVWDLPWSRSILSPSNVTGAAPAVKSLVIRLRPDVVHVHTPIAGFLTRAAIRLLPEAKRPLVVYTTHGFHFYPGGRAIPNGLFLTAERVAGRWTDCLAVINQTDEDAALRYRIVPRRRLVRLPGVGIDTDHYSVARLPPESISDARASLGAPDDAPLFVVVGELRAGKRPFDAVKALARMRRDNAHLCFIGTGKLRNNLERLASALEVGERVHFAGFVSDPRPLVAGATASVLTSGREGLSRALMESMCLEVPVIASDARGNREVVGERAGFIYPIGDIRALARLLDRLAGDPVEGKRIGSTGRERVGTLFALPMAIAALDDAYARMLSGQRSEG